MVSFFGETSLLTGEPQSSEVKAQSIVELAYLTKHDFLSIMDKFPTLLLAVKRISDSRIQTAQNVQKMKMTRDKRGSVSRRISLKSAAKVVMMSTKRNEGVQSTGKQRSESRSTFLSAGGPAMRLAKRAPSSRRKRKPAFNLQFLDSLSLGQARKLVRIQSIEDAEIESNEDLDEPWALETRESTET